MKVRILRFLHTSSHNDVIGDSEHDQSLLGEARPVLKDLLELIRAQDPNHFSAMVKVIVPPGDEDDDE